MPQELQEYRDDIMEQGIILRFLHTKYNIYFSIIKVLPYIYMICTYDILLCTATPSDLPRSSVDYQENAIEEGI